MGVSSSRWKQRTPGGRFTGDKQTPIYTVVRVKPEPGLSRQRRHCTTLDGHLEMGSSPAIKEEEEGQRKDRKEGDKDKEEGLRKETLLSPITGETWMKEELEKHERRRSPNSTRDDLSTDLQHLEALEKA
ncbi:hypothetical protein GN956_G21613 [Arapaima gigas]